MQKIRDEKLPYLDIKTLPEPSIEGLTLIVFLKKAAIDRGKKFCEFSQIERIDFRKLSNTRVRILAAEIWALSREWWLIPLKNGYFMLKLDSRDDMMHIWA